MDARTKAFQALKPICVALGGAAKALSDGDGARRSDVSDLLGKLRRTLSSMTAGAGALHPKLAEYVFFPISQVLRVSQKTSIQCLELCLQCIAILIDHGWREHLPAQTATQLVILCTLLAEKKLQGLPFTESTEELQASAFQCLYQIFTVAGDSAEIRQLITADAHFPQLGKTITVMLDGAADVERPSSQEAASAALEALLRNVADREIRASFLPGIMSMLTKILRPSTKGRTAPRVLVKCLEIIKLLLKSTLGDRNTSKLPLPGRSAEGSKNSSNLIDEKWQLEAAEQLRPALSSIMTLRSHHNNDVGVMLGRMCMTLLRQCQKTLANCSTMALETLVVLASAQVDESTAIELEMLLQADFHITSLLESLLYDWLQSLTTTMHSVDERPKLDKLVAIRTAYGFLFRNGADMSMIDRTAVKVLGDSVVTTLAAPGRWQHEAPKTSPVQSLGLALMHDNENSTLFHQPLVKHKGQEDVMFSIERLLREIASRGLSPGAWTALSRSLQQSEGESLIANFWVLLTVAEKALQGQHERDSLFNGSAESTDSSREALDDLYSYAITVLTEQISQSTDTRLSAISLRVLALRARIEAQDFRFELVDALYPVLHTLATPDELLQRDCITTLNVLTTACGYASVKDLIVENVDYLTNAVALKLNAFDVSPQAPQVLLMMLRLAGPSLLPYLEDTVESIFAALEDYHGYPLLVELLFKVLGVMTEEGVKAPQLAIEGTQAPACADEGWSLWSPTTVDGLAIQLRVQFEDEVDGSKLNAFETERHPTRPWGRTPEASPPEDANDLATADQDRSANDADPGPPAEKTYNLLLKITELTQHFLPSASPSLRTSLLRLVGTSAPALAKHENSFLPLINTLWPEIVSRLDEDESHIITAALDTVRVLCECAGNFMRTRLIQLWPRLVEIHQQSAQSIARASGLSQQSATPVGAKHSTSTPGYLHPSRALDRMQHTFLSHGDTSARLLWHATQALITAVVLHVHLPPEYLDDAVEMVESTLDDGDVGSALEKDNNDAVWLMRIRSGAVLLTSAPTNPGHRNWKFAEVVEPPVT